MGMFGSLPSMMSTRGQRARFERWWWCSRTDRRGSSERWRPRRSGNQCRRRHGFRSLDPRFPTGRTRRRCSQSRAPPTRTDTTYRPPGRAPMARSGWRRGWRSHRRLRRRDRGFRLRRSARCRGCRYWLALQRSSETSMPCAAASCDRRRRGRVDRRSRPRRRFRRPACIPKAERLDRRDRAAPPVPPSTIACSLGFEYDA